MNLRYLKKTMVYSLDLLLLVLSYINLKLCYAHRTLHDATRQDNPRQENRVMCGGLRHNATRQDKNRALS